MTNHHASRLSVRALLAATAPLLLLVVAGAPMGCARGGAELRLTSLEKNAAYLQSFSNAYVSKAGNGGSEIVLINEQSVRGTPGTEAGDAVPAAAGSATTAVRQVMHLRILWKPQRGAKQSHPSYTNAGLHWYVFTQPAAGGAAPDVLEYRGAGFVTLAETAAGTEVTIKNATVKPVGTPSGSLTDPVGPARLTGTFLAKQSPKRVNALLAEVKTVVDGAGMPQAAAE